VSCYTYDLDGLPKYPQGGVRPHSPTLDTLLNKFLLIKFLN